VIEGLRHFRTIYPEAKAREQIAAIHRGQGNTRMLTAVERQWEGSTSTPALTMAAPAAPKFNTINRSATPTLPTSTEVISKTQTAPAMTAVLLPRSKFFDTKIPIPIPKHTSPPVTANSQKPASPQAVAHLPNLLPATAHSSADTGLTEPRFRDFKTILTESQTFIPENPIGSPAIPQPKKHRPISAEGNAEGIPADLNTLSILLSR
jgi:hypothetical protein